MTDPKPQATFPPVIGPVADGDLVVFKRDMYGAVYLMSGGQPSVTGPTGPGGLGPAGGLGPTGPTGAGTLVQVTTWDPLQITSPGMVLSNGNKTATTTSGNWAQARATGGLRTGKSYWKVVCASVMNFVLAGMANASAPLTIGNYIGGNANGIGAFTNFSTTSVQINGVNIGNFPALQANGDAFVLAYDQTAARLYVSAIISGVLSTNWNATSANPSTGTGGFDVSGITGTLVPACSILDSIASLTLDTISSIADATLTGFTPYDV